MVCIGTVYLATAGITTFRFLLFHTVPCCIDQEAELVAEFEALKELGLNVVLWDKRQVAFSLCCVPFIIHF
jgi:hypothetical protein